MINQYTSVFKIISCLLFFIFDSVITVPFSKLPKNFVLCNVSDLAFDKCLTTGLQSALPQLAIGIPSLGLLKMDPLRITTLGIEKKSQSMQLKLDFKNLDINNMKYLLIKKAHYDPVNFNMSVVSEAQNPIILKGLYEIDGKIFILPITGNGRCNLSLDNFKLIGSIQMTPSTKNGNIYLEVQNLTWKFTTTKLHIKLENLFNGDKILGDNMNVFLNENWQELLNEMQSSFEQVLGYAFIGIIQQFFNHVPLGYIFSN